MKLLSTKLSTHLLEPAVIPDVRGWFQVAFSIEDLHKLNIPFNSVYQLNHSYTEHKGVVRGPNYQMRPYNQAKVIRVVKGAIYSVGIDIDPESENYGHSVGFYLSAENKYLMYVPNTYAHGFTSLEDDTEIEYFTDNVYCYEAAKSFRFDDKALIDESGAQGIDWTMEGKVNLNLSIRSDKNSNAPDFKYCEF